MVDYPNVPDVPGVPPVNRDSSNSNLPPPNLDVNETVVVNGTQGGPQWGIFLNGQPVVTFDNVVSFEFKRDWSISDYQVEQGAFQSYDKVEHPFDARVRFSTGGSVSDREASLASLEAIAGDLNLYDVAMPEKSYPSVNIVHYDFVRKSDNGLGLLIVDVYVEQVRDTAQSAFSSTSTASATPAPKAPSASPTQNNGVAQPLPVPAGTTIPPSVLDSL